MLQSSGNFYLSIAPGDKNEILEFPNEHLDSGAQCQIKDDSFLDFLVWWNFDPTKPKSKFPEK